MWYKGPGIIMICPTEKDLVVKKPLNFKQIIFPFKYIGKGNFGL